MRSVDFCTTSAACRRSSGVASGSANVTSIFVRITASGLRNSCDASWMNSRCDSKASSIRPSMPSKVSASCLSSSSGPLRFIRRLKSVAWMSRATSVIRPIGLSTRPATDQPTPMLAMKSMSNEPKANSRKRVQRPLIRFLLDDEILIDLFLRRADDEGAVRKLETLPHTACHGLVRQAVRQPDVNDRDEDHRQAEQDRRIKQRDPNADRAHPTRQSRGDADRPRVGHRSTSFSL